MVARGGTPVGSARPAAFADQPVAPGQVGVPEAGVPDQPGRVGAPVLPDEAHVLALIKSSLPLRTSAGLEQTILTAIGVGALPPGTRLPTIRTLAAGIGMSPSAVGQAWSALSARGALRTRRRGGTVVQGAPHSPRARRFNEMNRYRDQPFIDLANLRGDALDRPSLQRALEAAISQGGPKEIDFLAPIEPLLLDVVRGLIPGPAEDVITTHGVPDAVELLLSALVRRGDHVIVENPTHPRILDVMDLVGGVALPVPYGPQGPDLAHLAAALARNPVAMIYQPLGSIPTGRSVTPDWVAEAAALLEAHSFPIIEISHTPLLFETPATLATRLPSRVLHVTGYTFFFGIDIRVGILSGPHAILDSLQRRLTYATRYPSGLLQRTLAFLLSDQDYRDRTAEMVAEAIRRRHALAQALRREGIEVEDSRAPSVWVPVAAELDAVVRLRDDGIVVYPGALCEVPGARNAPASSHLHVGSTAVVDDAADVARRIAAAARASVVNTPPYVHEH